MDRRTENLGTRELERSLHSVRTRLLRWKRASRLLMRPVAIAGRGTLAAALLSLQVVFAVPTSAAAVTTWSELPPLDSSRDYGHAVAVDGDVFACGAPLDDDGAFGAEGAVYIHTRSATGWTQLDEFLPEDSPLTGGQKLGFSIACDAGTVVAGAPEDAVDGVARVGSVYVYTLAEDSTWSHERITPDDGGFAYFFGYSVAVSGETVVVGAPADARQDPRHGIGNGMGLTGAVYIYTRSSMGSGWDVEKLPAPDLNGESNNIFGASVAIDGDTLVVGTPGYNPPSGSSEPNYSGAVHVYERGVEGWGEPDETANAG